MIWQQHYDPLGNVSLSTLMAALPVCVLLGEIAPLKIRVRFAVLAGLAVALAVSPHGSEWKVIGIPFLNQFVEPSSFGQHACQYVIHYQAAGTFGG